MGCIFQIAMRTLCTDLPSFTSGDGIELILDKDYKNTHLRLLGCIYFPNWNYMGVTITINAYKTQVVSQ